MAVVVFIPLVQNIPKLALMNGVLKACGCQLKELPVVTLGQQAV